MTVMHQQSNTELSCNSKAMQTTDQYNTIQYKLDLLRAICNVKKCYLWARARVTVSNSTTV